MASALEWWRDAGVDMLVEDVPRDWLGRAPARRKEPAPEPSLASTPLPDTLESFIEWRMGPDAAEAEWLSPRIAPSGPAGGLMVLVDMPEKDDEATLTGGAAGRLLDRMLAAIGESRESVHLAAIAWARPVTGIIPAETEQRLGELALHHVQLVRPTKLLLLGQTTERVLPAMSRTASQHDEHDINLSNASLELVASFHPRFLVEAPVRKAEAWSHLLRLSRGTAQ